MTPPIFLYYDAETEEPRLHRGAGSCVYKYTSVTVLWHPNTEKPLARKDIIVFNKAKNARIFCLTDRNVEDWESSVDFAQVTSWMYVEDFYNTSPY